MWSYFTGSGGPTKLVGGKVIGGPTQDITVTYKGYKWHFKRGMLSGHSRYFYDVLQDGRTDTVDLIDSYIDPFVILEALMSTRSNCKYYDVPEDKLPLLWHAHMHDVAVRLEMPALCTRAEDQFRLAARTLEETDDNEIGSWFHQFVETISEVYNDNPETHGTALRHIVAGLAARKLTLLTRTTNFDTFMSKNGEFSKDVAVAMVDLVDEQRRTTFIGVVLNRLSVRRAPVGSDI
ncbi:hypothetical protein IWZ01DRAFT_485984 [Phyllosticta capitalensis]